MLTSKYLDSIANNTSTFFVIEGTVFQLFTLLAFVNKTGNKDMNAETSHLCCFQQLIIFMKKVELPEPFPDSTFIKKWLNFSFLSHAQKYGVKKKYQRGRKKKED